MRIALAGFMHESNTFSEVPTTLRSYREAKLDYGKELIPVWKDAHHEVGGFLEGAERFDFEVVPILMAQATPSGPVTTETYETIVGDILQGLEKAGPLDGLLLALHGAMVCESYPDGDGETLQRLRRHLGEGFPMVVSLDMHANISEKMLANSTAMVTYRSNPHIDQRYRGLECAEIIAKTLRGQARPVQAMSKPPLLIHIAQQYTEVGILREIMAEVERISRAPGFLSASFAPGFAYADVAEMGPTALVVADGDRERAETEARRLADMAWTHREELNTKLPGPEEAVREAAAFTGGPVTLMDCGDNVGGGGPGDSTIIFSEVLRQGVRDCLVILYDPESVQACIETGVGKKVRLEVGAKTNDRHGTPVAIEGRIRILSDGKYFEPEPRHGGRSFGDMGLAAVVETAEGHSVVLHSLREPPLSLHQILSMGIRPETRKIMIAKGVVAPRAAYNPVSAKVIVVDSPGVTAAGPEQFVFKNRRRPLYPLD